MGVAPIISYNYGSKNTEQLKKVICICFYFIMIVSIFVFLLSFAAGENIAWVFAKNNKKVFEITKPELFMNI